MSITSNSAFDTLFCEPPVESNNPSKPEEISEIFLNLIDKIRDAKKGKMLRDVRQLATIMTSTYLPSLVEENIDTVAYALINCIVKGSVEESVRASHCLAIAFLTMGVNDIPLPVFDDCFGKLAQIGKTHLDSNVKMAALVTIGVMISVGCNDDAKQLEGITLYAERAAACRLSAEAKSKVAAVAVEAEGILRAWMFLFTLWPPEVLGRHYTEPAASIWEFTLKCLMFPSPSLKMFAGQCVGLLMEAKWMSNSVVSVDRMEKRHPEQLKEIQTLAETSGERDLKGLGRDDKRSILSVFRAVAETVESGVSPNWVTYVGSRDRSLTLKTWLSVSRHAFLRGLLRGSLASHLKNNETVRVLIGINDLHGDDFIEETQGESRDDRESNAKGRQIHRSKDRKTKNERMDTDHGFH